MQAQIQRQPRKLIICCDGTWNERDTPGAITNVAKMARAIRPIDDQGISQLVYYHPGVGTGNRLDRMLGGGLGVGLSANVQSAYSFLVDNFEYGDFLYFFGFSRGAFTARSLAGLVSLVGLLQKKDMEHFPNVYEIYRSRDHRKILLSGASDIEIMAAAAKLFPEGAGNGQNEKLLAAISNARPTAIFFVGVWDTVGSLGAPAPFNWIAGSRFNFHNTDLSENVIFAYHAVAIDEERASFRPTLWTRRVRTEKDRPRVLEQVWFAGCHSNVGGGYEDCGLSDITFLWMASKAAGAALDSGDRPLAFDADFLRAKVGKAKGALLNSRAGVWRLLPRHQRRMFGVPPAGKETCEKIHASVLDRYRATKPDACAPFPYRPQNAEAYLGGSGAYYSVGDASMIAELSKFEKTYSVV